MAWCIIITFLLLQICPASFCLNDISIHIKNILAQSPNSLAHMSVWDLLIPAIDQRHLWWVFKVDDHLNLFVTLQIFKKSCTKLEVLMGFICELGADMDVIKNKIQYEI